MKVLLSPVGSRGDVQPMLALAQELRAQGHTATFCTAKDFQAQLEREGFKVYPVDIDVQATAREMGDTMHHPRRFLAKVAELMHRAVEPLLAATPGVDVVLGGGAQIMAASVCQKLGVPYRFAAYCPTMVRSRAHAPITVRAQGLPGWVNGLLWSVQRTAFDLVLRGALDDLRRGLGLPPAEETFRWLLGDGPVLGAFDAELVRRAPDWEGRVLTTGAWTLARTTALDPDLEAFLQAGPRPVYVGFGSMTHTDPEKVGREVLAGIRAAGVRALVSAGWSGLGKELDLPPGCRLLGEVSHAVLFPRLAAVVHHGGAGTTATALRAGVPQVVVPHLMDQFYWGDRVHAVGVGPAPVRLTSLRGASLAAAIHRAVSESDYHACAQRLAAEVRPQRGTARAVEALQSAVV